MEYDNTTNGVHGLSVATYHILWLTVKFWWSIKKVKLE